MAAYTDRRDGRWRYRKRITGPDGRRVRIAGTPATDTKKAAEAAEHAHIERVMHPERAAAPAAVELLLAPTLTEYVEPFMAGCVDQKPSEIRSKRQILAGHLVPALGHLRLDAITQADVDAFTARELRRVTRKTVNNRLGVLSSLLGYAAENRLIVRPDLRLNLPRKGAAKAPPIVALPFPEVDRLLVAASDDRYRVAILLAVEAGLRIGEILGLQWGDVRADELRIRRAVDSEGNVGPPKHDKVREIPLSPRLAAELEQMPRRGLWVVSRRDGGMLSYWAAIEALRATYARAGVDVPKSESGESMPWHSLRHTFGTECAARGVPLSTLKELMGHSDIATTLRYVTVSKAHRVTAIEIAFGQQVGNRLATPDARSKSSTRKSATPTGFEPCDASTSRSSENDELE